jgi:hypothetical protein
MEGARPSLARQALAHPQHAADLHAATGVNLAEPLLFWVSCRSSPVTPWNDLDMQYDSVKTKRSLPWRVHTTESDRKGKSKQEASQRAYEVWVSEIMAQQTQVSWDDLLEVAPEQSPR